MFKKKKNPRWLLFIAVFVFLILLVNYNRSLSFFEKVLKDSALFSYEIASVPIRFFDQKERYQDPKLKARNDELEYQLKKINQQINLELDFINQDLIPAYVLNRRLDIWFDYLTINKGEVDGIMVGDVVLVDASLVGIIQEISYLTSEVQLITSADYLAKISVKGMVDDSYEYGVLAKYDNENDLFLLEGFTFDFEKKTLITTTGLTPNFPPGLIIGEVVNVGEDNFGLAKIIEAEPIVNFDQIRYVTVISGAE